MTVDSAPGRGTEVVVKLLRRKPVESVEEAGDEVCAEVDKLRPLSILVVDDDERTRYLIEKLLANQAETLTICSSGAEALKKFRELSHTLVLTDKAMPGMDGEELADQIKSISQDTPIIMLTGFGDLMGESGCPSSVDLLLSKPITRQQLYEAIESATA